MDIDTINRIEEESKKLGKQQVLYVTIKRKVSGRGEVLVGFQDRIFSDKDLIRYESDEIKSQLNKGEFKLHEGILYFYPNVDLEWKPTPKKTFIKLFPITIFLMWKCIWNQKTIQIFNLNWPNVFEKKI